MKKKLLLCISILTIMLVAKGVLQADTPNADVLEPYKVVLNEINVEYGRAFEIDDVSLLDNIVNKMTIEEFREKLIEDAKAFEGDFWIESLPPRELNPNLKNNDGAIKGITIDEEQGKKESGISPRISFSKKRYGHILHSGTKSSTVYADFSVGEVASGVKAFGTFYEAGYYPKMYDWYFLSRKNWCSFGTYSSEITYQGYWIDGTTNMAEPITWKIPVVFYP